MLKPSFYSDPKTWDIIRDNAFVNTWHFVGDDSIFKGSINAHPITLYDKYLDEPLLLVHENDEVKCISNVCTHRGFILVDHPKKLKKIICGYHGRRFDLDGTFEHMPEFEGVQGFPRPCDNLTELPLKRWNKFLFTSIKPTIDFDQILRIMDERVGFLPIENFEHAPEYDRLYSVKCHWALYCDNFLEGFHIPFVHETLNNILDYGQYETICDDQVVLQIGYGDPGSEQFELPEDHIDYGKVVTAYYYWVFPNLMFNFYPWGVQLNIIQPIDAEYCKVRFIHYIHDKEIWERMDGATIAEKTEREDEFVVESVQKGIQSRLYPGGQFSAKRESGVSHFHKILESYLP